MFHAIGGGTGSGLGSLILSRLTEEYGHVLNNTISMFPSPKLADKAVEPYNSILATYHLTENATGTIVMDNEALYNICRN